MYGPIRSEACLLIHKLQGLISEYVSSVSPLRKLIKFFVVLGEFHVIWLSSFTGVVHLAGCSHLHHSLMNSWWSMCLGINWGAFNWDKNSEKKYITHQQCGRAATTFRWIDVCCESRTVFWLFTLTLHQRLTAINSKALGLLTCTWYKTMKHAAMPAKWLIIFLLQMTLKQREQQTKLLHLSF